jgi:hypothetical protein
VKWYRKAADQGHAKAQSDLGYMYSNGEGVPEDDAEAVKWVRKAADQGLAKAQHSLGAMYSDGEGVLKDEAEFRKTGMSREVTSVRQTLKRMPSYCKTFSFSKWSKKFNRSPIHRSTVENIMARDDFFEDEQSEPMEIHATISVEQNFPGLPPFHLKQKNVNVSVGLLPILGNQNQNLIAGKLLRLIVCRLLQGLV